MKHFKTFNPEHDLALANGDRHFIAPRNIRDMARDLAPLLEVMDCNHPIVWGWDSAVKEQLLRRDVPPDALPTDRALLALRQRSGRASAHRLLTAFRTDNPEGPYSGESMLVYDTDEIDAYAALHGHVLLKDPLSSSGKGLRHVRKGIDWSKTKEWAKALISRHGYLTAEPYYNKIQDFAMEFHITDRRCRFIGYSLFTTNAHGRYEGNALMEDTEIEEILSRYVPCTALHTLQSWIIKSSSLIVPEEWDTAQFPLHFGIDMMIVDSGRQTTDNGQQTEDSSGFSIVNPQFRIHPCVEINLRLNMGIIAHEVRRLLAPDTRGTFHVAAFPTAEALQTFRNEQTEKYPPVHREGKIVAGYHPLTPIHDTTRHHAYVITYAE